MPVVLRPLAVSACRQQGFSLVELMVGMVLGLVVMAAAGMALLASRSVAATVSDASHLQQQASYALRVIGLELRQSGSLVEVALTALSDRHQAARLGISSHRDDLERHFVVCGIHGVFSFYLPVSTLTTGCDRSLGSRVGGIHQSSFRHRGRFSVGDRAPGRGTVNALAQRRVCGTPWGVTRVKKGDWGWPNHSRTT